MKSMVNRTPETGKRIRRAGRMASCLLVAVALACYTSHRFDCGVLRSVALDVTADATTPAQRVVRLVDWLHDRVGSERNTAFFGWRGLGATAAQVLRQGGDCADKSRLLCALLREVDISATPALCFDADSGEPTHTVVEARLGPDRYMVADPAFGLYFPTPDLGGFHDLLDIRRDAGIVDRRVEELYALLPGAGEHDRYYLRSSASYGRASTFNWDRNWLTRAALPVFRGLLGDYIYRVPRPGVLEEPKLWVALCCLLAAMGCWLLSRSLPGILDRNGPAACSGKIHSNLGDVGAGKSAGASALS